MFQRSVQTDSFYPFFSFIIAALLIQSSRTSSRLVHKLCMRIFHAPPLSLSRSLYRKVHDQPKNAAARVQLLIQPIVSWKKKIEVCRTIHKFLLNTRSNGLVHPTRYGYVINKLFYDCAREREKSAERKKSNKFCMRYARTIPWT